MRGSARKLTAPPKRPVAPTPDIAGARLVQDRLDQRAGDASPAPRWFDRDLVDLAPSAGRGEWILGAVVQKRRDVPDRAPSALGEPDQHRRLRQKRPEPGRHLRHVGRLELVGPVGDVQLLDEPVQDGERALVARAGGSDGHAHGRGAPRPVRPERCGSSLRM